MLRTMVFYVAAVIIWCCLAPTECPMDRTSSSDSSEWNKISHIGKHNIGLLEGWDAISQEYSDEVRVLHGWIEINSCIPSGNLHSFHMASVVFKLLTVSRLYHIKVVSMHQSLMWYICLCHHREKSYDSTGHSDPDIILWWWNRVVLIWSALRHARFDQKLSMHSFR